MLIHRLTIREFNAGVKYRKNITDFSPEFSSRHNFSITVLYRKYRNICYRDINDFIIDRDVVTCSR